jgi:hypothetical protein
MNVKFIYRFHIRPEVGKFIKIIVFYTFILWPIKMIIIPCIVNHLSRKPVRKCRLSNKNPGTVKSIAGGITLVKLSAIATIVLLLYTHEQS